MNSRAPWSLCALNGRNYHAPRVVSRASPEGSLSPIARRIATVAQCTLRDCGAPCAKAANPLVTTANNASTRTWRDPPVSVALLWLCCRSSPANSAHPAIPSATMPLRRAGFRWHGKTVAALDRPVWRTNAIAAYGAAATHIGASALPAQRNGLARPRASIRATATVAQALLSHASARAKIRKALLGATVAVAVTVLTCRFAATNLAGVARQSGVARN